jgi:ubiquinol-cytochrome c reductase cytochrome c subunit
MLTRHMRLTMVAVSMLAALVMGTAAQTPPARTPTQTPAPPSQAAAAPPAGDAEKGKALFVKNGCYQCHNYEGQGGSAGARLAPNPLPFRGFIAYVRAPRGDMPPYTAKVMSDQDLADVHAYLRGRPRPPAVASLPLLAR